MIKAVESINAPVAGQSMADTVEDRMKELCGKRNAINNKIKDLTETKKAYDEAIKNTMGDYGKETYGEYHVAWIETETKRIDTKKVKSDYPDVAEQCMMITNSDRLTITYKKSS